MDESLIPFHRQYLQQVIPSNIRYPPPNHLVIPFIQQQIYRYFFNGDQDEYLPPPDYQRRVLKRIIGDVERELSHGNYDVDEYEVYDELMSHMGELSALPQLSDSESAQTSRTLSYFLPTNTADTSRSASSSRDAFHNDETSTPSQRILVQESPNLLAAGSNVGLRTWEASLHLAYYLCTSNTNNNLKVHGANILELGAGTGLLSLICALPLRANHVLSTDGLTHVVEGIGSNIKLNLDHQSSLSSTYNDKNNSQTQPSIKAAVLDWTKPEDLDTILELNQPQSRSDHSPSNPTPTAPIVEYDLILGADITYHPDLFPPLSHLIRQLKQRFPRSRVLISATVRNEHTMRQFKHVCESQAGLKVREIKDTEWKCPSFREQTGLFHEQIFPIVILEIELG